MSQQKTNQVQLKAALKWVKPRIIPAIVWMGMLPFVAVSRVLIGFPLWLIFFFLSIGKKQINQLQQQQESIKLN